MDKLYSQFNNLTKPIKTLRKIFVQQNIQSAAYKSLNKHYFKEPSIPPTDYNQNQNDDGIFYCNPHPVDKRIKTENNKPFDED